MSRIPFIAGNWKMNKTTAEAVVLVKELLPRIQGLRKVQIAVFPPATALNVVASVLESSEVELGAQDIFWEESGAYTGMISPIMLLDVMCKYVIIGHSERRGRFGKPDASLAADAFKVFGDTDVSVNLKAKAALRYGLLPIICVGETLVEREQGRTDGIVSTQMRAALDGISAVQMQSVTIAYEPVWAIGTGRACDAAEANRVMGIIRRNIEQVFNPEIANVVTIQYGGSVTEDNAHELLSQSEIDGALVGGASLDASRFAQIVHAAAVIAKDMRKS